MVHLEGELVPVGGEGAAGAGDQPGVVDQGIDPGVPLLQRGRQVANLIQAGEVGDVVLTAGLTGGASRDTVRL
jgi:hypothetical protein